MKCRPTLSSIVSHTLSINLKPWNLERKITPSCFPFVFSKSSPSKMLSFQILTRIFQIIETQNPEMHGHLWNADVYNPNPLVYYVLYMFVDCCLLYFCLQWNCVTVAFAQCGSLLVRFECERLGVHSHHARLKWFKRSAGHFYLLFGLFERGEKCHFQFFSKQPVFRKTKVEILQ